MSYQQVFGPPERKLKLTAYIFKYPKQFWLQAAGGIIYNTVVVFGAVFLGKAIDAAGLVYEGTAPISLFYWNLGYFLAFTVIFQLARYFKRYYMRIIINLFGCDIRAGLLDNLFATPLDSLSHEKTGDLMSRMFGDAGQVVNSVKTTFTEIWDTVLLMFSYLVACLFYSPRITLLAAIPITLTLILAELLRHPLYSLSLKSRKAASRINVHLQHNVSGIALLRLFGLEEADQQRYSKLLNEQLKWQVLSSVLQSGMAPIYIFAANLGIILVIGMGGAYVIGGTWTIGTFTAYLAMFTAMATRTNIAAKVMNTWHEAKASWDRICEKLDEEINAAQEISTQLAHTDKAGLVVDSLSFVYPFSNDDILKEISFSASAGEIIGITGSMGSGKSALAAALSGLFPYRGAVFLDGLPLNGLGAERSKKIAYMDSQHFVFSDDVSFNITLNRGQSSPDESVLLAALSQDIDEFENGMDTRLMERGVRVSGGQRQRISLARAWYGDNDLVILDDPFSAVDIAMEQLIMENIRKNIGERIVLLFSHRLSTFPMTDKIIVLQKGQIVQYGTHIELQNQSGLYKDIYIAQDFMRGDQSNRGERDE